MRVIITFDMESGIDVALRWGLIKDLADAVAAAGTITQFNASFEDGRAEVAMVATDAPRPMYSQWHS